MARDNERGRASSTHLEIGATAAALLSAPDQHVIFLACDEVRAEAISRAASAVAGEAAVIYLPATDALPGDEATASPSVSGRRVAALRRVAAASAQDQRVILVTSGEAAARLIAPPDAFQEPSIILSEGVQVDLAALRDDLLEKGYIEDDRIDEPGEVAIRDSIADIFPAASAEPVRIEVADGQITALRFYDPLTQLGTKDCEEILIDPINEPAIGEGVTLLEHLPNAALAIEPGADERRKRVLALAEDVTRREGSTPRGYCSAKRWSGAVEGRARLDLLANSEEPPPRFVEGRAPDRSFVRFAREMLDAGRVLLLLGTARDLRFLERRVARALKREVRPVTSWVEVEAGEGGEILSLPMAVTRGFTRGNVAAVAAGDLLGRRAGLDLDDKVSAAATFAAPEVRAGDVVIDEDHGLGVIDGLADSSDADEAIVVRYAGEAKRLVPVLEAGRLWRYGSEEEAVTLDRLDGSSWAKRRDEVMATIAETARGLVERAREGAERTAPVLQPDDLKYERLAGTFPYAETADQLRAIAAIRDDLSAGRPMDRLVIGDVGFGKTEVAIRAAAMAIFAGRQVVVSAPTTVLARQHYETFRRRFEPLGVEIALLSRLVSTAERRVSLEAIKEGRARLIVGTSAVAGKGVHYPELGLVVIDEEQRFGTRDKEKLRDLGAPHVLGMTATPIPRTLQSALVGLQSISILATPPARRQPIRTDVMPFDGQQVRAALLKERARGGQSFVVVPRIEGMVELAQTLRQLVPDLRLVEAHGKMPPAEIDEAMVGFADGKGDILLATNIIEAGLDVPRANTMVVVEAERFGLAQLHQLRGRVGRGARRGLILLMTAKGKDLAPPTKARLQTLAAFDSLGAGFAISARDLDLRGGGDLLGEEQTGHLKLIGVDLYQHLLEGALRTARGEAADDWTPELRLEKAGRIPRQWIPEEEVRLNLYLRLARITQAGDLEAFEEELVDRFGELPAEVEILMVAARIRLLAKAAEIARIDVGPAAVALTPRNTKAQVPDTLTAKGERWLFKPTEDQPEERFQQLEALLADLAEAAET